MAVHEFSSIFVCVEDAAEHNLLRAFYYCGRRKARHNLPEAYVIVTWLVKDDKRDVWFPQICQCFCPKSVSGQQAVLKPGLTH